MSPVGGVKVAVLTVGDELLSAEVIDSNFPTIAESVQRLGLEISEHLSTGDDLPDISASLRYLLERSDVVIVTGGLGPTHDDVTRESVADATGAELQFREDLARDIRLFFEAVGRVMAEENLKQAYLPKGARVIGPAGGTAPGFMLDYLEGLIVALPGVPREMRVMLESSVLPELEKRYAGGRYKMTRRIMTFGTGESDLASLLSGVMSESTLRYGFLAMGGPIAVKVTADSSSRSKSLELLDKEELKIRSLLGPLVYGVDDRLMEEVLGDLMREKSLTIAVAESCTGGMLGERITGVSGSSDYFLGGIVCYDVAAKKKVLGVPEELLSGGAVSKEVAASMAESARRIFGADIGVSITCLAGPGRGREDEQVGTVCLGLATEEGTSSWKTRLPGNRATVRSIAATAAMNAVRLNLLGREIRVD